MYNLSLQQIEFFLKVAEFRSFSKAAKAMFIAQPTISKWIKALETELRIELFTRNSRDVELTQEGKYLYEEWEAVVRTIHSTIRAAHGIRDGTTGVLKVGCLYAVNYDHFLPALISDYEERYTGVKVEVSVSGFREIREFLINGVIDVAFSATFDMDGIPDISHKAIEEHRLYIVVPANHPLAKGEQLRLIDLKAETFYMCTPLEVRSGAARTFAACRRSGFEPKNIQYVPNFFSLAMAIKQGKGVTVCSKDILFGNEEYIRLFQTEDLPIDAHNAVYWRTKNIGRSTLLFVEMINRVIPGGGYE